RGGRFIAIGRERLQVFDSKTWEPVQAITLPSPPMWVQFSNRGRELVVCFSDGNVGKAELDGDATLAMLPRYLKVAVVKACFSADDRWLAIGGEDGRVCLIDATDGRLRYDLSALQGRTSSLAFTTSGENLATSADDGTVRVWDVRTGRNVLELREQAS